MQSGERKALVIKNKLIVHVQKEKLALDAIESDIRSFKSN